MKLHLDSQADQQVIDDSKAAFETQKENVKNLLIQDGLRKRAKLRTRLLINDPSKKKFWSYVKKSTKKADEITAAYNENGSAVYTQSEIEDSVLNTFTKIFNGQDTPVFTQEEQQDQDERHVPNETASEKTNTFEDEFVQE